MAAAAYILAVCLIAILLSTTTFGHPNIHHVVEVPSSCHIPGSTLIVGGVEAAPHEFPHIVSLRLLNYHRCGGSMLDPLHILTAARCLRSNNATHYSVSAGDHNLRSNEGTEQVREGSSKIIHQGYGTPTPYSNDIAILRLSSPLEFNGYVQPAHLPEPGFVPTPKGTVSGWGLLKEGGSGSMVLMKVAVPHVNDTACSAIYPESYREELMVCYGQDGKDSCQTDAGGPLMCGNNATLCGIAPFRTACARPEYPAMYTRVSNYVSWINDQINV